MEKIFLYVKSWFDEFFRWAESNIDGFLHCILKIRKSKSYFNFSCKMLRFFVLPKYWVWCMDMRKKCRSNCQSNEQWHSKVSQVLGFVVSPLILFFLICSRNISPIQNRRKFTISDLNPGTPVVMVWTLISISLIFSPLWFWILILEGTQWGIIWIHPTTNAK